MYDSELDYLASLPDDKDILVRFINRYDETKDITLKKDEVAAIRNSALFELNFDRMSEIRHENE